MSDGADDDGRLLVKLSAAKNGRAEELLAYEWKVLIESAGFALVDEENGVKIRPAVQTFYEEAVVESDFLIKYEGISRVGRDVQTLSKILVQSWCREMGHGLQDQPRLEVLNQDGFFMKCTQQHQHIDLLGFSLGNFINFGLYIEHFKLDMSDLVPTNRNFIDKGEMEADFLHDNKKMIVKFTLGEFSVPHNRICWHLYKMTLDYGGVHSVVVDYSEKNCIVMYMRLKYVPKIVVDAPKNERDPMKHRMINQYNKYNHNFFRVSDVSNWGKKFGRCSTLKLVFRLEGDETQLRLRIDEFWEILSRMKCRAKVHVYFLSVRSFPGQEQPDEEWICHDLFESFSSYYLVRALLSRGYAVHDQIDNKFATAVARASHHNPSATNKALERLLAAVDEHRYISLLNAFIKLYDEYAMRDSDSVDSAILDGDDDETEVPRNCVRVRKLVVTPTRELLMPPEVMMSNRVLRQFGEDYAMRVLFRDEDMNKLRADRLQEAMFKALVSGVLLNGRKLGNRHYKFLAWSNSQLRDHGCYMYCRTGEDKTIADIRRWMGDFTAAQNVPKFMSRMGQCFTQAQEALKIKYEEGSSLVKIETDITGGEIDQYTGEPYVFSDGIGRMSLALAKKVCETLELDQPTPSAYQIRYAGCKGMLSVDVRLDKDRQGPQLILRDSMKKFDNDTSYVLEIVKHSQPSPVYLNRPLIMILDQVSGKQGPRTFARVTNRIHKLLEKELFTMAEMLLSETVSVEALTTRTTLNVNFRKLRDQCFSLTTEPFFRGLLLAIHLYTLKAQLFKAKIEIPPNQGRTMYGVLDETGVLQYGQVFVQFSQDLKKPGENLKLLSGKVMVTKNPCIVPGDVRLFTAVYKDSLKHLHDVIVFPRNGPRPHTDEMAGSDLDGDEFAVYFDLDLMFDRNEEAMHFPKLKADRVVGGVKDEDMVSFFHTYIKQDCIGSVSTAHLVYADRFGIYNPNCMEIAKKCSMAVDFPKTGKPAERLTEDEAPYKYPDYMQKEHRPMYRSRRLLGQLFRKIKTVSDIVELGRFEAARTASFDEDLRVDGWELYERKAKEMRNRYVHHLQALLDQYGVQDEAQLISGKMVSIRNRLSDGEKEDFSFFNTEKIIELRITKIFQKFRREFFDDFGGERPDLLDSPTEEVQQKASAYYVVTYDAEYRTGAMSMLSFPWLVWEVLGYIKSHKRYGTLYDGGVFIEPVQEQLTLAIERFNASPAVQKERNELLKDALNAEKDDLVLCMEAYGENLAKVLFVVLRWCLKENVYRQRALHVEHVALLLVHFATGACGVYDESAEDATPNIYMKDFDTLRREKDADPNRFRNKYVLHMTGSLLLEFVKYLSSQKFRTLDRLDFGAFSRCKSEFKRKEWAYLNSVAFKTYHHIAWTSNFKSLHLDAPTLQRPSSIKWDRDELDPLPVSIANDSPLGAELMSDRYDESQTLLACCQMLKEWSGMDEVKMRFDWNCFNRDQYFVVGVGSLEARNKLKDILLCDDLDTALYMKSCPENFKDDD